MRATLLGACAALALFSGEATATQIISFGQTSGANTVTGVANAGGTSTTITITDAVVLIDQLFNVVTPPGIPAFVDLSATSTDFAATVGPAIVQHYNGTFCISSGAGCTGTIDLQGVSFADAAFGDAGGSQLSLNVADPPDVLTLSSDLIPLADLTTPTSFTLSMSNISTPPGLDIDGMTIADFTASFSGVANATPAPVIEASALSILLVGVAGTLVARHRRNRRIVRRRGRTLAAA
jgi:hypothetical protein